MAREGDLLKGLVERTDGLSPADLNGLVAEAGLVALREVLARGRAGGAGGEDPARAWGEAVVAELGKLR